MKIIFFAKILLSKVKLKQKTLDLKVRYQACRTRVLFIKVLIFTYNFLWP